jgi:PAS domain S-box-containing protein
MDRNETLRKRAEERIESQNPAEGENDIDSKLIHDLQVYQIELEIQNDELRHTEQVMQKAKDAYMRLYDQAPVGYITIDKNMIITMCNKTFMAMVGKEPVGKPFHTLLSKSDRDLFMARFKAFFNKPEEKDIELDLSGGDAPIPVRLSGQREEEVETDEEHLLVIVQDITYQRKAEEEKAVLLKEVHHRVKNNMSTIMSLLSLQAGMLEEPGAVTALEEAKERVATMLLIYNSLFRSEQYRSVHIKEYLQDLLNRIGSTYRKEGTAINLETSIANLELQASDAFNLGIIINELVTNALKYAFEGKDHGTIWVNLSETTEENGTCTTALEVRDDGKGLDRKQAETASGGFGLTLVESLAGHFNGELRIEALNPGTSFSMLLDVGCVVD